MKKFFKWTGLVAAAIVGLVAVAGVFVYVASESKMQRRCPTARARFASLTAEETAALYEFLSTRPTG